MVRGCQKRTVHIRDTSSRYYEEAFFILKPGALDPAAQSDMIEEAMRIAEESLSASAPEKGRKRKGLRDIIMFASGFGTCAVICAVLSFVLFL